MRYLVAILFCGVCWPAEHFSAQDVKILGDIEYGQTSASLDCSAQPRYCALVFNGTSGERVEVTVKGGNGKVFVAFADGSLTELARGAGKLAFTLKDASQDLMTYYIIFSDAAGKPGQFTVSLRKVDAERRSATFRRRYLIRG